MRAKAGSHYQFKIQKTLSMLPDYYIYIGLSHWKHPQ
jgi:hypothetical protein